MAYECELVEQAAQPALSIRTRTSLEALPQVVGESYVAISRHLTILKQRRAGAPFVAYHGTGTQDLDVEIGLPVQRRLRGLGTIRASEIPAGIYATCLHEGSYVGLPSAYEALAQWVADHGYQPTGVAYEMYLTDPSTTTPEELLTQVSFLLLSVDLAEEDAANDGAANGHADEGA